MKNVINYTKFLTVSDVQQSLKNGWIVGRYKGKRCLENEKTIFLPVYMPRV